MNKKYILGSGLRVARFSRLIAKLIDLFIVLMLSVLLYPLGIILSIIYISIADSLMHGQSVGKKLIGFSVLSLIDGTPCSIKQSIIRNLPIAVPLFFAIIPLWGWIFSFLIAIPLISLELYLLFKLDSGHRLGDVMADTTVIGNDPKREDIKKREKHWAAASKPQAL